MALNPQLFPNGMPIPFTNEMFVLVRHGVEFEVDKIPGSQGGRVKAWGIIYLSNIRMVFVASRPVGNFFAFDMPLINYSTLCQGPGYFFGFLDSVVDSPLLRLKTQGFVPPVWFMLSLFVRECRTRLYVHDEKFNQPIFHCNNISGQVEPVVPENEHRALYSTHSFKILFKEGGCGTFVPLFLNLIASVRRHNQQVNHEPQPRVDPLQAAQTPVDEMMRHAYVDPNDPTKIFLQQPTTESQLRRRTYQSQPVEGSM
ncbi:stress-induced protein C29B12.11c [Gossypium australe]|uniref:Stress-induced protein C29B12.11c n=1 Tax=Gossypium australe TaxID=47621 RepID=A0A5B6VHU1_9ROSI|nr:stress-induced protein C29B12.11c [Gossypium australe]